MHCDFYLSMFHVCTDLQNNTHWLSLWGKFFLSRVEIKLKLNEMKYISAKFCTNWLTNIEGEGNNLVKLPFDARQIIVHLKVTNYAFWYASYLR